MIRVVSLLLSLVLVVTLIQPVSASEPDTFWLDYAGQVRERLSRLLAAVSPSVSGSIDNLLAVPTATDYQDPDRCSALRKALLQQEVTALHQLCLTVEALPATDPARSVTLARLIDEFQAKRRDGVYQRQAIAAIQEEVRVVLTKHQPSSSAVVQLAQSPASPTSHPPASPAVSSESPRPVISVMTPMPVMPTPTNPAHSPSPDVQSTRRPAPDTSAVVRTERVQRVTVKQSPVPRAIETKIRQPERPSVVDQRPLQPLVPAETAPVTTQVDELKQVREKLARLERTSNVVTWLILAILIVGTAAFFYRSFRAAERFDPAVDETNAVRALITQNSNLQSVVNRLSIEQRALGEEREIMLQQLEMLADFKANRDDVDAQTAALSEQLATLTARLDAMSFLESAARPLQKLHDNPETQAAYAGLVSLATAIANGFVPFGEYSEIKKLLETSVTIPGALITSPNRPTTVRLLLRQITEGRLVRT